MDHHLQPIMRIGSEHSCPRSSLTTFLVDLPPSAALPSGLTPCGGEVCDDGVVFGGAGVVDPSGVVSTCSPYLTKIGLVTLVPASRGKGGSICINMEGNLGFVMRNLRP